MIRKEAKEGDSSRIWLDGSDASTLDGCYLHGGVVLPPLSVGDMTLRRYGALNHSQNTLVTFATR